jgi:hypothetical protein
MKNHVCALHGIPPSSRAEVALPHGRLSERSRGGKGHGGQGASIPDGGHVFDGVDGYGGGRLESERLDRAGLSIGEGAQASGEGEHVQGESREFEPAASRLRVDCVVGQSRVGDRSELIASGMVIARDPHNFSVVQLQWASGELQRDQIASAEQRAERGESCA